MVLILASPQCFGEQNGWRIDPANMDVPRKKFPEGVSLFANVTIQTLPTAEHALPQPDEIQ